MCFCAGLCVVCWCVCCCVLCVVLRVRVVCDVLSCCMFVEGLRVSCCVGACKVCVCLNVSVCDVLNDVAWFALVFLLCVGVCVFYVMRLRVLFAMCHVLLYGLSVLIACLFCGSVFCL